MARQEILKKINLPFKVFKPNIDETPIDKETPQNFVKRISLLKAEEAQPKEESKAEDNPKAEDNSDESK